MKKFIINQPKKESPVSKQEWQAMNLARVIYYLYCLKDNNDSGDLPIIEILGACFSYFEFQIVDYLWNFVKKIYLIILEKMLSKEN